MVECGIPVVGIVHDVGCRGDVVVVGGVGAVEVVVIVIVVQLEVTVALSNRCNRSCSGSS